MGVFDYFPFMYFLNYLMGYQHFALSGLRTCLVIRNQDPTPEYLLDCKIGNSPVECSHNLSAVRLETTQVCFPFTSLFVIKVLLWISDLSCQ